MLADLLKGEAESAAAASGKKKTDRRTLIYTLLFKDTTRADTHALLYTQLSVQR